MKWLASTLLVMGVWGTGFLHGDTAGFRPMTGLRVPVAFYPDGTLKNELTAKEALVLPDGRIVATGIVFRVFSTNATLETTIQAADAVVDRVRQTGHSERPVSLVRDDLLLTGEGFEWSGLGETIRILNRVRMTFPSEMFKEREGAFRDATDPAL